MAKDFFRAVRDSNPDIGAHEFIDNSPVIIDTNAPSALIATVKSATSVKLNWSASTDNEDVAGYIIYRNGIEVKATAETSFTDTSVTENTSYSYAVKAYDGADNLSNSSNTVLVNTPSAVELEITSRYVGNSSVNSVTINWTTNTPSTGIIYYGTNHRNLSRQVSTAVQATKQSVKISGLTRRTRYYYKIIVASGSSSATSRTSRFRTARR